MCASNPSGSSNANPNGISLKSPLFIFMLSAVLKSIQLDFPSINSNS